MAAGDLDAARDQIQREISDLERSLGPDVSSIDVIVSGSSSSSSSDESDDDFSDTLDEDLEADELVLEDGGHRVEMCLQMNLVYQAVLQEKLQEVEHHISQNKAQQEELLWELAGRKTQRVGSTKPYPANLSIGHFYKPYFKDKASGVGPPANPEMMARSSHTVKTFKELASKKWRTIDEEELRKAVLSDSLQKMIQPKLFKLEYLQQKRDRDIAASDTDKIILTKQIQEVEQEINEINHLPEETLLGQRTDDHDWEKISNVNLEGIHNADRISKMWKNDLHPHINKEDWGEEEIKKLQEIAQEHNHVNWEVIAEELGTKRTAFQCLQQFQHNNKDFKRKAFIKEEDEVLKHLVQRMRVGMHIPYHKIAYFMEGRNSMQLLHRWSKCLDPSLKKGYWNKEEDKLLLKAVEKYGEKDWYKIQLEVPGRSDIQCRERYMKGLHKDVKKGQWSREEQQKLIELTEKYGVGHWSKVSKELTHRTGSQCLSKWKNLTGYFKRQRLKRQENPMPPKKRAPRKRPRKRPQHVAPQEQLQSMGQQERPPDTAPEQRQQYTAPEQRQLYTELKQRSQYTALKIKKEELSEDDISDLSSDSISSYISSSYNSSSSSSSSSTSSSCSSSFSSSSGDSTSTSSADGGSSSSSSEDEDDLDDMHDIEKRIAATRFLESMPDLESWIPRKDNPDLLPKKATSSNFRIPRSTMRGKRGKFQFSTILKGIAYPPSTDTVTEYPEDILLQAKESGHHILQICEDDVRRILRWNTVLCQGKKARQSKSEDDTLEQLPPKSKVRKKNPPVDRSLLISVTPWVGNVFLPIQVRYKSQWESQIYADVMTKKLSALTISSTPIFTLLIQFFQINTAGCLQMIRLRKERGSQSLQKRKRDKAVDKSLKSLYAPSSNVWQSQPAGSVERSKDESRPQAKYQCPPRDPGPPSKPKTVFELLREKRLQESKARRAAAQRTVVVAPRILISSQLVVTQTPIPTGQPENPTLPAASTTSQNDVLQTLPFVALPTCHGVPAGSIASAQSSPASGSRQGANADKTAAPVQDTEATDKCNSSPSAACPEQPAPAMASPQRPIQLLPGALSNSTTWILTPQGLIQIPVQALFPTATQVAINPNPGSIKAVDPSTNGASSTVTDAPASTSSTVVHPPVPESNRSLQVENTQGVAAPCVSPAPQCLIQIPVQALFPTAIQAPINPDSGSKKSVDPSANKALSIVPDAPACTSSTVVHPPVPESNRSLQVENTQGVPAPFVSPSPQCLIQIPVQALLSTATQAPVNQDPVSIKAVDPSANRAFSTVPDAPASSSSIVVHPPESNWSSPLQNTEGKVVPCASPAPSPHKSTEVTLTPTKTYPVVKIDKIVPPNQPNTGTCNIENSETPAPSQTSNQASTSSAQRNFGDLSLISLEDETSVKNWMQGKSSGESQESSMTYLPPSACTLKTFSRILLQKTNLEEQAFKLVPPAGGSDGGVSRKQEILDDLVEQKLKNNPAYNLLKKRFLSAFTFAGLLAVFPAPNSERTKPGVKSEVKDEDEIMDIGMYDKNTEGSTGGEFPGATTELHPREGEVINPDDHCAPVTIECESEAENFGMRLRSRKVYCLSET